MVSSPYPEEPITQAQNLYRAAFMQSGSPLSLGDLTQGQRFYDDVVIETGCSLVTDSLACLRRVPYERIRAVMDRSPGFLDYEVSFCLIVLTPSFVSFNFNFKFYFLLYGKDRLHGYLGHLVSMEST